MIGAVRARDGAVRHTARVSAPSSPADPDADPDADAAPLVDALLTVSRAMVALVVRSLSDVDMSLAQFRSLVVLRDEGPKSTSELAASVGVHQSTATRGSDRLAQLGLVTRERDPHDRRRVVVTLTEQGRTTLAEAYARRRQLLAEAVGRMQLGDVAQLVHGLDAFSQAALPGPAIST